MIHGHESVTWEPTSYSHYMLQDLLMRLPVTTTAIWGQMVGVEMRMKDQSCVREQLNLLQQKSTWLVIIKS